MKKRLCNNFFYFEINKYKMNKIGKIGLRERLCIWGEDEEEEDDLV